VSDKSDGLLADEAPIHELDELQGLIAEGQERGFLTIGEITNCLEEVEVTKEQIAELHGHLVDQGVEIVDANGKPVGPDSAAKAEAAAEARRAAHTDAEDTKKPSVDLTVEPSLDSLRLYLRSIGKVPL
jgi:RNA polymerase primary sigma factor